MVHTAEQPETAEPRPSPGAAAGAPDRKPRVIASAVEAPAPPRSPTPSPAASAPTPPPTGSAPDRPARSPRPVRRPRVRSAPRRTRVVVRKVSPLSVLKFSLLFYLCLMLIVLFAMVIVYAVLSAYGAIESFEKVLGYVFGTGTTSTGGAEPIEIDGGAVFTWGLFGGLILVGVWSLISVFVAMLYNLISDIIGGVEVTLAERPQH
jgi:hypothetical protein